MSTYTPVETLPQIYFDERDQLLERFEGRNLGGINTERVMAFCELSRFAVTPYIVVWPEEIPEVNAMDSMQVLASDMNNPRTEAVYNHYLDLIIVKRREDIEVHNGRGYTESLLIHEEAHANTNKRKFVLEVEQRPQGDLHAYSAVVNGFNLPDTSGRPGCFYEEGWAEHHRGQFIVKHSADGVFAQIAKAAKIPNHTDQELKLQLLGGKVQFPAKYLKLAENGKITILCSAVASLGLDLLMQADGDLYGILYDARFSDDNMKYVKERMDRIRPGLFSTLRRLHYNQSDFEVGLAAIDSTLGTQVYTERRNWFARTFAGMKHFIKD
jgi:hypothetical protein